MPFKDVQKGKDYQHQYYLNNKESYRKASKKAKPGHLLRKKLWFQELKGSLVCIKCGENHIACLDFHHRDPNEKEMGISYTLYKWGKKRIMAEIEKCDVLCSNCHRKFHFEENGGT